MVCDGGYGGEITSMTLKRIERDDDERRRDWWRE
jgi:hypothetical protein